MKRIFFALSVLIATTVYLCPGQAFSDTAQNDMFSPIQVLQCTQSPDGLNLSLAIRSPHIETVSESNLLQLATYSGAGMRTTPGEPATPTIGRLFRLPSTGGITVEVLNAEFETLTDIRYAARVGELDEADIEFGACTNLQDAWYPGPLVEAGDPAIFHDFRVASLITNPVQVNPARNEIRVYSRINLNIRFEGTDSRNSLPTTPHRLSKALLPFYREMLDWNEDELDDFELYRGGVQVIMQDDPVLFNLMEDWFRWKRQKGWILEVLTDSDVTWTGEGIRSELLDRYQQQPFDYVVVVGDNEGRWPAPASSYSSSCFGDFRYGCMAGDDYLVDLGVGRISIADSAEAAVVFSKLVAYEESPFLEDTSWYNRGLAHISDNHTFLYERDDILQQVRQQLLNIGYTTVDTLMYVNNSEAIAYLNAGVSVYAHNGYFRDGPSIAQIAQLTNYNMLPVVNSMTEYANNCFSELSFMEAWFRAGVVGAPTGAIGGLGLGHTLECGMQNVLVTGALCSATLSRIPELGGMSRGASVSLYTNYYSNRTTNTIRALHDFNLIGDPTTWLWTDIPAPLTVAAPDTLAPGWQAITCFVTTDEGTPVEDAWVTMDKTDNGDEWTVPGETDAYGVVTVLCDFQHTGEATLTVTAQNCQPYRKTIVVSTANTCLGIDTVVVYDDGSYASSGDGDGIAENGERIALRCQLANHDELAANDITLTALDTDQYITHVSGSILYTQIAPGESDWGNGAVLVDIHPSTPDSWLANLQFSYSDQPGHTTECQLAIAAPAIQTVSDLQVNTFRDVDISIPVVNNGNGDLSAGTARLFSNCMSVEVQNNICTIAALEPGEQDILHFNLNVATSRIAGFPASLGVCVNTENNGHYFFPVTIILGIAQVTDPVGPDEYGYMAFDDSDTAYLDYTPHFDWVELDTTEDDFDFVGNNLGLSDEGEGHDAAALVPLPFDVQYYGETFDCITVVTNGIAAFGDQQRLAFSRNRIIPDPLGPQNMLAPYWDNLNTNDQTAILTYYDALSDRFIIEWSQLNYGQNYWTFEIILYNQETYPTPVGDTDILFQYLTVTANEGTHGSYDVPGFTTGIENGSQDDGLLYAYTNEYATGAAPVENNRAILFTSSVVQTGIPFGGQVLDADSIPLADVLVLADFFSIAMTDQNGYFHFDQIPFSPTEFSLEKDCYTTLDTIIEHGEADTLEALFVLGRPDYQLEPEIIVDTLGTYESATHNISITNSGSGRLDYSLGIEITEGQCCAKQSAGRLTHELDQRWDRIASFGLDESELHYRGLAFDDETFWISGSNGYDEDGPNKLYRYSISGDLLGVYDQPVLPENRSPSGMMGLDYDDHCLYGVDNGVLYTMTFADDALTVTSTTPVPVNPARYLAVDPERGVFWMGDTRTEIKGVNLNGQVEYSLDASEFRFCAGDMLPVDPGSGMSEIAFLEWDNLNHEAYFHTFDPSTGNSQIIQDFPSENYLEEPIGACITRSLYESIWTFASIVTHETQDSLIVWELTPHVQWLYMPAIEGSILPGETCFHRVTLNALTLAPETYTADLVLYSTACSDNPNRITIQMTTTGEHVEDSQKSRPLEWALDAIWPNPFNPTTNIRYGLKEATTVHIRVYDVLGREVTTLKHESQAAGWHVIPFTAHDLASGVYFLRVEAGPLQETRKLILLK